MDIATIAERSVFVRQGVILLSPFWRITCKDTNNPCETRWAIVLLHNWFRTGLITSGMNFKELGFVRVINIFKYRTIDLWSEAVSGFKCFRFLEQIVRIFLYWAIQAAPCDLSMDTVT